MVQPTYEPNYGCLWPIDDSCLPDAWAAYDDHLKKRSRLLAQATLRRLTANRVGGCPVTVRPCSRSCVTAFVPGFHSLYGPFFPGVTVNGEWVNSCGCQSNCGCETANSITLPPPIGEVYEVKVDGVVVDPATYYVAQPNLLVGSSPWPATQDLSLPDTEPGTFSITYLNSHPFDAMGQYALALLSYEFAKACSGTKCRLPGNVTAVSRQGVSYELVSGAFPGGLTTIREVDAYISLWNPNNLTQRPRVWFPGINQHRTV